MTAKKSDRRDVTRKKAKNPRFSDFKVRDEGHLIIDLVVSAVMSEIRMRALLESLSTGRPFSATDYDEQVKRIFLRDYRPLFAKYALSSADLETLHPGWLAIDDKRYSPSGVPRTATKPPAQMKSRAPSRQKARSRKNGSKP